MEEIERELRDLQSQVSAQTDEIRELIEKPYRIIYRIKEDQIDVLAVIHGSRLFPDEL